VSGPIWSEDLNSAPRGNFEQILNANFSWDVPYLAAIGDEGSVIRLRDTHVDGIALWFDVEFQGSEQSPAQESVILSTHPKVGYQHWGQQLGLFPQGPLVVSGGNR